MTTMDLDWSEGLGFVQFAVTGVPAGYMVYRISPNNQLYIIPEYHDASWLNNGQGIGVDTRPALGVTSTYVIAPIGSKHYYDDMGWLTADVTTPDNEAWLKDVTKPAWATRVIVVDTGDEGLPTLQRVYNVSGRHLPLVVHDVRQGRTGQVKLLVGELRDPNSGALIRDGRTQRNRIEQLLSTGNPLYLAMCPGVGWTPCMMTINTATFTRVGANANWTCTLDYVQVDDPVGYIPGGIPWPTYQQLLDADGPGASTYQWVRDNYDSYADVATGNRNS